MDHNLHLDLHDLVALRVLGRGATGTVFLVTHHSSTGNSPPFALKVVEKSRPAKPEVDRRARWEVNVLSRLSHPFLPCLLGQLETAEFLGWAMPFCPGGDLNYLRNSQVDGVFSSAAIRFYVSEIIMAVSHLHKLGIVYRDLKPENVLIQESGHVTLTDFDLSRYLSPLSPTTSVGGGVDIPIPRSDRKCRNLTRMFLSSLSHFGTSNTAADDRHRLLAKANSARVLPVSRQRTTCGGWCGERSNSFVGTEEYVSPEVVSGDGHDFAVDWWGLGILTYEMAYGTTPFRGRTRKETFYNVQMRKPEFVGRQSSDLTDFISRLLAKDPSRRLGSNGGAEEVKAHPFFHGVQWHLLGEVTRPPYLSSGDGDTWEVSDGSGFNIREYFEKQRLKMCLKELAKLEMEQPEEYPSPSSVLFAEF